MAVWDLRRLLHIGEGQVLAGWLAAGFAFLLATTAASADPLQPDTFRAGSALSGEPVDHILSDWLQAFNSGDRARIKAVHARYADGLPTIVSY
jgi:hypothetical protein